MKNLYILTLLSFTFLSGFSQTDLVYLDDLSYHSTFEEWVVRNHFLNGNISPFLLYSAVDPDCTELQAKENEKLFNAFLNNIEDQVNKLKKPKQKTTLVFNAIHERFLTRYRHPIHFSALFKNGDFNCVTATCIYAIAFERFKIPYEIVIAPGHSYLMAYPGMYNFVVETTNPVNGIFVLNDKKLEKYKQQLLKYKLINEHEYEVLSLKDFQYRQDSNVNLFSFVSYLYKNQALQKDMKPGSSFEYAQKTYIFNPIEMNSDFLEEKAYSFCSSNSYNIDMYKTILMYARDTNTHNWAIAKMHHAIINNKVSTNELPFTDYKKLYLKLKTKWNDSLAFSLDSIASLYYFAESYYYEQKRAYKNAAESIINLYRIEKDSLKIEWIIYNLSKYFMNRGSFEADLHDLKQLSYEFPELKQNKLFLHLYFETMLNTAAFYFIKGEVKKANKLKSEFEENYDNSIPQLRNNIVQVYITFASRYFKLGKNVSARQIIEKGLEYAPNDLRLFKLKMSLN